jgi:hypothetical protein
MKIAIRYIALLLAFPILGGCGYFNEFVQRVSVDAAVEQEKSDNFSPINLDTYPAGRSVSYYNELNPDDMMRNSLQEAIIGKSEITCSDFRKNLYAIHAARKIGFQSSALILSTAAAVVGGTAAQVLSGTSTGLLGVDETIDANALQNSAIAAVLNTIKTERTQFLQDMRKKQKRGIKAYPMEAAVSDAIHYNKLCSLTEAISALNTAAEKKAANAETIKQIRIANAETMLRQAEDDLGRSKTAGLASDLIKIYQGRVDRAAATLKRLQDATTSEAVEGANSGK